MKNVIMKVYEDKMFVHNGIFHADDIFCVALVNLIRSMSGVKKINTIRVSDIKEIADEDREKYLVCDLLGGDFDHHMAADKKAYRDEEHKFPYASFGLLWKALGSAFIPDHSLIVEKDIIERLDEKFIMPIDYVDNFGPFREIKSPVSRIISNFNTMFKDQTQCFNKAVEIAESILQGEIQAEINELSALKLIDLTEIRQTMGKNIYSYILIPSDTEENKFSIIGTAALNEYCSRKENNFMRFVINLNPSPRDGSMRLMTIGNQKLTQAAIDAGRKMDGCVFIHNAGFLATFKDLESTNKFVDSNEFEIV